MKKKKGYYYSFARHDLYVYVYYVNDDDFEIDIVPSHNNMLSTSSPLRQQFLSSSADLYSTASTGLSGTFEEEEESADCTSS